MTRRIRARRRTASSARPRATAARQALRLCETGVPEPARDAYGLASGAGRHQDRQHHHSPAATKAALRAVGVPPHIAAKLCRRLRLTPEQQEEGKP